MANIFTDWANRAGDWLGRKIAPYINDALGMGYNILGSYYSGDQRKQLKTKVGQTDDNVIVNFIGLAVDRSVSRLWRGGVKFKLPQGRTEQQKHIDKVWDLNKKEIALYQVGLHGAVYGTTYFKIQPEALKDPLTKELYPRLTAIDPEIIRVHTAPQDMNELHFYVINYKIGETAHWQITIRDDLVYEFDTNNNVQAVYRDGKEADDYNWQVDEWQQVGGGARTLVESIKWPYDFPPIIHWKNLPSLKSCYGDSDIDDAINVQDKSNFVISNTGKIIKFHAHPETIGTGFSLNQMEAVPTMPGSFHAIPSETAKVYNLEMASDLASSRAFALDLRQSIFDISREVDISSMADKLGQLTNFGLQVLWSDAIDKNDTKRQLYGDALKELNRRLLVLANNEGELSDPGSIQWGNPLPVNWVEEMTADQKAIDMGIVDKETVANRYMARYGVAYEDIKAKIEKEQEEANQNNADIGSQILKNFSQGKGAANARPANNRKPTT
jgi:hypothetical protein